jgi:hypothetical protein
MLVSGIVSLSRKGSLMSEHTGHNDRPRSNPQNPFKPASLNPAKLNTEAPKEIKSSEVKARKLHATSFIESRPAAAPVSEHSLSFSDLHEHRPDFRVEKDRPFALKPIPVTPVQMQRLRERRVDARALGWSIEGHRIRIES